MQAGYVRSWQEYRSIIITLESRMQRLRDHSRGAGASGLLARIRRVTSRVTLDLETGSKPQQRTVAAPRSNEVQERSQLLQIL
jgi:hypothetical protein